MAVTVVIIVEDGGSMHHRPIAAVIEAVSVKIIVKDVLPGRKHPPVCGRVISPYIEMRVDQNPRPDGRPAIVITAVSPGNPGARPFITRRPEPSMVGIPEPTPVMKRRPAPGIVRNPYPAMAPVPHPVTARIVRPELPAQPGLPYLALPGVINPVTMRTEFMIKSLVRDFVLPVVICIFVIILIPDLCLGMMEN